MLSNVGDLYSFAGDLLYGDKFYFIDAKEGSLINSNNDYETSFNYSDAGNKLIIGLTKLNAHESPSNALGKTSILSAKFFASDDGSSVIDIEIPGLFDSRGNQMFSEVHPLDLNISVDTSLFKLTIGDNSYQAEDTIKLVASTLGLTNLKSVSFDLVYDKSKVKYLNTKFDGSFSNYGQVELISDVADNQNGMLTFGMSRVGIDVWGSNDPVVKFADFNFEVIDSGKVFFQPQNIHYISPYSSVEFPVSIFLDTANTTNIISQTTIKFDPDTVYLMADSISMSNLSISNPKNIFSVSGIFNYEPNSIQILDLNEGDLLNEDSVETSFIYNIDSTTGKIEYGITRLGNNNGGISSDTVRSLLSIRFKKIQGDTTNIGIDDIIFIDPLGNQSSPVNSTTLYILSQDIVSSQYFITPGWNMLSLPLQIPNAYYQTIFPNSIENTLFGWNGAYTTPDTMKIGSGYWLKFPDLENVGIQGTELNSVNIDLVQGWNMIGGINCDIASMNISDPEGIIIAGTLFGWEGTYTSSDTLKPGNGYWMRTNNAGTIIIDCSTKNSLAKKGKKKKLLISDLSDFSRIKLTDATGMSQKLFFGKKLEEGLSLESYSMPPLPPPGLFDARFEGDYRLSESENVVVLIQSQIIR